MRTLRSRLLAGYAALVLLTVVLASGASLLLFDLQGRYRGMAEMAAMAQQLARAVGDRLVAAPATDDRTALSDALRQSPYGRPQMAEALLVDDDGQVVAATRRTPTVFVSARFRPQPFGDPIDRGSAWCGWRTAFASCTWPRPSPAGRPARPAGGSSSSARRASSAGCGGRCCPAPCSSARSPWPWPASSTGSWRARSPARSKR
ncbi:MAG: hypothetical protein U0531_22450 [Dehalococcoidia bacterium]